MLTIKLINILAIKTKKAPESLPTLLSYLVKDFSYSNTI